MNYRHHYHAGNFADVMKHALLLQLVEALGRKEKGWFYLDTHAGRGRYDLARSASGETRLRTPEWPDGIGRLWTNALPAEMPPLLAGYLAAVRQFDREAGNLLPEPRFYPGSPRLVAAAMRPQDRLALCEKHPAECAALRQEFARASRVSVHATDGYEAVRAMLPPAERRGLILLDPPFEAQDEFAQLVTALRDGLRRFAQGVFTVWYPLTERARVDEFMRALVLADPPPTLTAELMIAGEASALKMKGCGLLVINPPWQFDARARTLLEYLAIHLAQAPGGGARVEWLVPERNA